MRIGIAHVRIVGEHRHVIGREFVGGAESEGEIAGCIGLEEGLEGQRVGKALTDRNIRYVGCSTLVHRHHHHRIGGHRRGHLFRDRIHRDSVRPCRRLGRNAASHGPEGSGRGAITDHHDIFQRLLIFLQGDPHHAHGRYARLFVSDRRNDQLCPGRNLQHELAVHIRHGTLRRALDDYARTDDRLPIGIDDQADDLARLAGRQRRLELRSGAEGILTGHDAVHGTASYIGRGEAVECDRRPEIGPERIQALVIDGRHGFDTGPGFQAEGVLRTGHRPVGERREGQGQVQGRADPVELVVVFDRLPIFEIEDLHAYRFRPGGVISPFQGLHGAFLPHLTGEMDLARRQDFAGAAEYRRHGPLFSVRRSHADTDLPAGPDLLSLCQEKAAHRRIQHLVGGSDLEDAAAFVITDLLSGHLGRDLQVIQATLRQRDLHHRTRKHGSRVHDRTGPTLQGIRQGNRDGLALGVAGGEFHPQRISGHQITGGLLTVGPVTAVVSALHRFIGRHETAVSGIQHIQVHPDLIRHIDGGREVQGLSRGIHHLDGYLVVSGLSGRETELERTIAVRLDRLLGDNFPITQDLRADLRPGQAVAGIGLDAAADLRLFSDQEQLVHRFEAKREGRKDEFIHPERAGTEQGLSLQHLQVEKAAPLPFRQDEGAGDGAEIIGLQRLLGDFLPLGIEQLDIQGSTRKYREGLGQVTLEEDALELQRVSGIEGAPVQIYIALRCLLRLMERLGEIADRDLRAPADTAVLAGHLGLQGIIDPAVARQLLLHL